MPITPTSADHHRPSWWTGLWTGAATAAICYAEYLGLGAVLGTALLGYGDQSKSVGTLLVVLSACISCAWLVLRRLPYLAGPRGASLSALVLSLLLMQQYFPGNASQQVAVLGCMLLGCSVTLWLSSTRAGQRLFTRQPRWLMPAFIYASAVGIVAGAAGKPLYGCLQVAPATTWAIFGGATLLGWLWPLGILHATQALVPRWPRLTQWLRPLEGLSLIMSAAVVWLAYAHSPLAYSPAGQCARLGQVDLHLEVLGARWLQLAHSLSGDLPWPALLCALVLGLCVGCVLTIESRSALDALQREAPAHLAPLPDRAVALRQQALGQALLLPATTVPASYSQSRTQMLWMMGGSSIWAVAVHAAGLLGVALLASQWLAQLPQLALAVLMTLVAIQMVGKPVQDIWRKAYDASAGRMGLRAGLGLWLVLGLTALSGQVLLGFALPALMHGGYRLYRRRRFAQHLRTAQTPGTAR